ncbi:MAG TPA: ubiquitin-like small modifier protein 1 [Candidatus Limnocylindrales bacterium]|nr:ubiquitin-like small modifier protein 1 [Candidatus Limnocylindrales bacterium]
MARVTVRLYGAYSDFAGGARSAQVEAGAVGEALDALTAAHPALRERLRDERGALREHLSVFANAEEIRFLEGERTALHDGDVVHVMPAVSGGGRARVRWPATG